MKHTPAPWRIAASNFDKGFYVINANDHTSTTLRELQVVRLDYGSHPDNSYLEKAEANAKLIAAAPELLEALKVCYKSLCTYGNHPIIEKQVQNAIDKATL